MNYLKIKLWDGYLSDSPCRSSLNGLGVLRVEDVLVSTVGSQSVNTQPLSPRLGLQPCGIKAQEAAGLEV